jgi:hypothetical protein
MSTSKAKSLQTEEAHGIQRIAEKIAKLDREEEHNERKMRIPEGTDQRYDIVGGNN